MIYIINGTTYFRLSSPTTLSGSAPEGKLQTNRKVHSYKASLLVISSCYVVADGTAGSFHRTDRPCEEVYVVREGETLHTISDRCGDPFIVEHNPHIQDPDDVFPGLVIKITTPYLNLNTKFATRKFLNRVSSLDNRSSKFTIPRPKPRSIVLFMLARGGARVDFAFVTALKKGFAREARRLLGDILRSG
ncbi:hypothetical protein QQ045_033257 [Rhodiola kirilowii]